MKIINIKVVGRNFTKVTPLILQDEDCETEESIGNRVEYWVFSNWPDYDLSWSWEFENDPEVILKVIQKEISETTAKIHSLKSYRITLMGEVVKLSDSIEVSPDYLEVCKYPHNEFI